MKPFDLEAALKGAPCLTRDGRKAGVIGLVPEEINKRGKSADDCPDSPRYKALGNSMAVPVMYWIGEKIKYHILNK